MRNLESESTIGRAAWRLGGQEFILLAFVVAVLILLSLTPLAFEQVIHPHRDYIEGVVQPARESVRDIDSRLTQEVALSRGYLLTREAELLEDHRQVQEAQRESLDLLTRQAAKLKTPGLAEQIRGLERLVIGRQEPVGELRRGEITPEQYVGTLAARQELLTTTSALVRGIAADLIRIERAEREDIRKLRRYQSRTLVGLALLAVLAVCATASVAVRLRRRAREEEALMRIASAMNAALGLDQITSWIGSNALSLLGGDAVLVERAHPETGEVEIAATSGRATTAPGKRIGHPGALVPEQVGEGGSRQFRRAEDEETPAASYLAQEYSGWSGAVFPLMSDRQALGSLVLLRGPGRPPLSTSEMQRGEVLANLAALAIRKILLLERSRVGWDRAEHLLAARSALIRGLSHDLRNPLGAILGFVQLLETGIRGTLAEEHRRYVERIRKAGESMDSMIQHLVEVGRSDTAEIPLKLESVSVQHLVREAVEEHRGEAEHSGLKLVAVVPEELPAIESDPIRIRTILGNLLSNAVKYTAHGRIEVRAGVESGAGAGRPGASIAIEVRDTGLGIALEDQETVFEEFSRLHDNLAPGEGIGLASSRRVARRLGGDLRLESNPGEGSTFVLSLPIRRDDESAPPQSRQS